MRSCWRIFVATFASRGRVRTMETVVADLLGSARFVLQRTCAPRFAERNGYNVEIGAHPVKV
jgi:hypothetical protein